MVPSLTFGRVPPSSETARVALIGPFSYLITFSGFDLSKSLLASRHPRCRALFSTIVYTLAIILFVTRTILVGSRDAPGLSYVWADTNIIFFMGCHSIVSLVALARWTAKRIYARVFTEYLSVRKLRASESVPQVIQKPKLIYLGLGLGAAFIIVTVVASVKRTVYNNYYENSTEPLIHHRFLSDFNLWGLELVVGVWMALCTVLATASFIFMHVAAREECAKFKDDLTEASKEGKLMPSIDQFSHRHIAILKLVSLITERTNTFVSFSTICVFIAQVNVFYVISAVGAPNTFGTVSCVFWGISTMTLLPFILSPPGTIQILLEESMSILANNEQLFGHPDKVGTIVELVQGNIGLAIAQLMEDRNRETPTRMAIMKAIKVNAQTPHLIGLIVPLIVAVLSYSRQFPGQAAVWTVKMTTSDLDVSQYPPLFSLHSHRLKIGLLLMFGLAVCVCMRTNLNMAVVCMVNTTAYRAQLSVAARSSENEGKCGRSEEGGATKGYNGTLEWSPQMQASLLTATFYGSLVTIAFSGSIADRFGPKLIFSGACIIYVIVTMATPFLAEHSFNVYFAARLFMGLAEGFIMPCIGSMAGRWFPPLERSTMAGIFTSGNQVGAASSSLISAALCGSPLGWHSIFYLFGTLGIVWIICFLALASNSPATNRFITDREAKFLESEIRRKEKSKSIPWRSLLKSKPMYACLCCQFAYNFSATLMQAFLPTYFRDELMIPLSMNGIYTTIPFAVQIFMKTFSSVAADAIKRRGILQPTTSAKVFQTLCALGVAISMISLAFLPSCDRPWIAAICLACYGIAYSFGIPGFFTALMSIAPQYSGTLTSLTMVSATIANISSPMLASLLMSLKTPYVWKLVFTITGMLNLIGGVICLRRSTAMGENNRKRVFC